MTGWNIVADIIKNFPPLAAAVLFVAAGVVFIVGFSKRGMNFIKYGFGQTTLDSSLEKRFDELAEKLATKEDIAGLQTEFRTELETIKVNHFRHLKGFLAELTSILLDKGIITNTDKARLDNQLRDM
jgi:hypothetical protein